VVSNVTQYTASITPAKPIPNIVPFYKDDPSRAKVFDFSMSLVMTCGSALESAIHALPNEASQFLSID
jgi:hypothetical protein